VVNKDVHKVLILEEICWIFENVRWDPTFKPRRKAGEALRDGAVLCLH